MKYEEYAKLYPPEAPLKDNELRITDSVIKVGGPVRPRFVAEYVREGLWVCSTSEDEASLFFLKSKEELLKTIAKEFPNAKERDKS